MLHCFVTLVADVMFANGIPFLMTLSRNIRLITAEFLPSQTTAQLSSSLTKVKLYAQGGFAVCLVLMDMEFKKVKEKFDEVKINTTAACEYVCEIER